MTRAGRFRAIVATLVVSTVIYVTVAVVAVGSIGSMELSLATATQVAPLRVAAAHFALPVSGLVSVGAMAAMLGVLLNLLPGLSRMLLAMGRRADMPRCVSKVYVAVVVGVARKRPRNLILQRVHRADQPSELP